MGDVNVNVGISDRYAGQYRVVFNCYAYSNRIMLFAWVTLATRYVHHGGGETKEEER